MFDFSLFWFLWFVFAPVSFVCNLYLDMNAVDEEIESPVFKKGFTMALVWLCSVMILGPIGLLLSALFWQEEKYRMEQRKRDKAEEEAQKEYWLRYREDYRKQLDRIYPNKMRSVINKITEI